MDSPANWVVINPQGVHVTRLSVQSFSVFPYLVSGVHVSCRKNIFYRCQKWSENLEPQKKKKAPKQNQETRLTYLPRKHRGGLWVRLRAEKPEHSSIPPPPAPIYLPFYNEWEAVFCHGDTHGGEREGRGVRLHPPIEQIWSLICLFCCRVQFPLLFFPFFY